jgi:hypothetical protein
MRVGSIIRHTHFFEPKRSSRMDDDLQAKAFRVTMARKRPAEMHSTTGSTCDHVARHVCKFGSPDRSLRRIWVVDSRCQTANLEVHRLVATVYTRPQTCPLPWNIRTPKMAAFRAVRDARTKPKSTETVAAKTATSNWKFSPSHSSQKLQWQWPKVEC